MQPKTPLTSPCLLVSPPANSLLKINQHLLNVQHKTPATSPCLLVSPTPNPHLALADDTHHPRPLSLRIWQNILLRYSDTCDVESESNYELIWEPDKGRKIWTKIRVDMGGLPAEKLIWELGSLQRVQDPGGRAWTSALWCSGCSGGQPNLVHWRKRWRVIMEVERVKAEGERSKHILVAEKSLRWWILLANHGLNLTALHQLSIHDIKARPGIPF